MDRYLRRKMIGQAGIRADATNPFYKQNMQVWLEERAAMNTGIRSQEAGGRNQESGGKSDGTPDVRPTKEGIIAGLQKQALEFTTNTAASLAIADEILLRVAPESAGLAEARVTVLAVIERDKAGLVALLRELAEALDGNAELNTYTGEFCTLVNPDWFGRLRRELERHTGVRVMDRLQLP